MAKKAIRPIRVVGNIAYVPLTKGHEAVIDAADASLVADFNWRADVKLRRDGSVRTIYAMAWTPGSADDRRAIMMHRMIGGDRRDIEIDHRDGNGLNNVRSNLRSATRQQNARNARKRLDNVSGVKGVSWSAARGKWQVRIKMSGKDRHVGYFDGLDQAASAYAEASALLHKEFGRIA